MLALTPKRRSFIWVGLGGLLLWASFGGALAQVDWRKEWERSLREAKREGKIVVGIPARAELRKQLEAAFKPKFRIDMELLTARGPQNASRIAAEYKAGVKYFDLFIGGSGTFESLVESGMVEPLDTMLILPEVKEAKNWWGGHIWEDNVSTNRFLYSFIADAGTGGFWYNTTLAKPEELRSLDEFLNPKWKGKVGFLDSLGRQRRELPEKAHRAGSFCQQGSASAGRRAGKRQARHRSWGELLHPRGVSRGQPADQGAPVAERRSAFE